MPNIAFRYGDTSITVEEEADRELLWYDDKRKKMFKFRGGKLGFKYAFDAGIGEYRLLPQVESVIIKKNAKTSRRQEAMSWLADYVDRNNSEISVVATIIDGLILDVPDDETDDFEYTMDRFQYEYEVLT